MHRSFALALIAVFLLVPTALAQSPREELTMHRKNAGELDASGWVTASSTSGSFSIRMPLKFNDFTVQMPPSSADVAKTHGVGANSKEGIKFVAQRIVYRRAGLAQKYFARIQGGKAFPRVNAKLTPLRFEGHEAVDVALENDRSVGRLRYVLLGDTMIYMIIEYPVAKRKLVTDAMVQTFFQSLKISGL